MSLALNISCSCDGVCSVSPMCNIVKYWFIGIPALIFIIWISIKLGGKK